MYIYINYVKFVKKELFTKNSRNVSDIRTTHGSKMFPKVKKQIKNRNIHRHSSPQNCCFFMYLKFVPFETGSVKWQTVRNM